MYIMSITQGENFTHRVRLPNGGKLPEPCVKRDLSLHTGTGLNRSLTVSIYTLTHHDIGQKNTESGI